ncbi:MAG: hypothetical protein CMI54_02585 [Parcubacteria group bacterium]|nr:hypothetical protein [Parcubacteria group bacterium]|tara:strand:+ start:282 stop:752 length:471 start_codon:yes stop_codon:yes gene_type:complete
MDTWFDGNGKLVDYAEVIDNIEEHYNNNGTVYVGSDSHLYKRNFILSSAIILHGADGQKGGRYFITRAKFRPEPFNSLAKRIITEAEKTIMVSRNIVDLYPDIKIELHVDVSNVDKNEATSNLAQTVIGYVVGNGFNCKVKPNAFAAATVADKHSK